MIFKTTDDGGLTNIFKEIKSVQVTFEELDKTTLRNAIKAFNNTSISVNDLSTKFGGLDDSVVKYLNNTERGQASIDGLSKSIDNSATSMISATAKAKILAVALNALTGLAISLAIKGITWAVDELIVTLDEQKEKLDEAVTAYEESKSELEQINDELKTTGERIDELNGKENLTFTEQDELQKLIKTNDELERKIYLLEQANKEAEKEVATEAQNTYDKYTNDRTLDAVEQIEFYSDSSLLEGVNWDTYKNDLSWLVAQYKNQQELLTNAQSNGWTTLEEQAKSNLELLEGYMSEASLDYQDLYDKINGISDFAMTEDLELAKQDLDAILDIVAEILGYGGERSETSFDDIWNSEDFSKYKTELETLAKEGKMDASVLESNENYKRLLKDTGATAEDTARHINALVEAEKDSGESAEKYTDSRTAMISQLNDMSEGFEELDKIYSSIKDEDPFDFKLLDDDNFKETFSGLGDVYSDFIEQVTTTPDDIKSCQSAFDNLVTTWLNSTGILDGVTDENANLTKSMLKQMGVANAEELVIEALTHQHERLAAQKLLQAGASERLANATAEEIDDILAEGEAAGTTKEMLAQMYLAKLDVANLQLNTQGEIDQIIALANAAGTSAQYVNQLRTALANLNSAPSPDELMNMPGGATKYRYQQEQSVQNLLGKIKNSALNASSFYAKSSGSGVSYTGGSTSNNGDSGGGSQETFNWIETALSRIQRTITNLGKTVSATWRSWTDRNSALKSQISAVTQEINLQNDAAQKYLSLANSVSLGKEYKSLVRDGALDISTITNENTIDAIKQYQEYYEAYLSALDAKQDAENELASLVREDFDMIAKQFDSEMSLVEANISTLEAYIDQTAMKGNLVSKNYYSAMYAEEEKNLSLLRQKYEQLSNKLSDGSIAQGTEEFNQMAVEVKEVKQAIIESTTALEEYQKTMRELDWEVFDLIQEKIGNLTDETGDWIELLSNSKLFNDDGSITLQGQATLGLHVANMKIYESQVKDYGDEIARLDKEFANDSLDKNYLDRRAELTELQRELILQAQEEKNSIKSLVGEGYDNLLSYMDELISKRKELLSQANDARSFQKTVQEQTDEIARLQTIIDSYNGSLSEEDRAAIQKHQVSLEEAKSNLEDTLYDQYISDQEQMLDALADDTEQWVNERLDNIDGLIEDVIESTDKNADTISETLKTEVSKAGGTLTTEMQNLWSGSDGIKGVIGGVNDTLLDIKALVQSMVKGSDTEASKNASGATSNVTPATKPVTTPSTSNTSNNSSTSAKAITVGGMINASGALIYDYAGDTSGERQYYRNSPYYRVLDERNGYLKVRHQSLSSGITGWFKKSDVKAYKTGGLVDETGLAWLDGTKSKPELVLNAKDTENFTMLTESLRTVANTNLFDAIQNYAKMPNFIGGTGNKNITNHNTFEFNMPNVTNGEETVDYLIKSKRFENAILEITDGKGDLGKYKYLSNR